MSTPKVKPPPPPSPMPTVQMDQSAAGDQAIKKQRRRSGFEKTLLSPSSGKKETLG